jgi:hypothetical protein
MAVTWTGPRTYTNGELLTKTIMDTHWRDNFLWLKTPTESGRITFAADFTTTSATFTDITGLTTTMTTFGGGLDVEIRLHMQNSGSAATAFQLVVDGVAEVLPQHFNGSASASFYYTFSHVAALAAGSHTIKLQVKCPSGTTTIRGTTGGTGDPLFYVREAGA